MRRTTATAHQDDLQGLPLDVMLCESGLDGLHRRALEKGDVIQLFQLRCVHMLAPFQGMLTGADQHHLVVLIGRHLQRQIQLSMCTV